MMASFTCKQRFLTLSVFLFSLTHLLIAERSLRTLDLNKDSVLYVRSSCCPSDAATQPCDLCPVSNASGIITDGNAFTEWTVNFTSTGIPREFHGVSFTFELGQVN